MSRSVWNIYNEFKLTLGKKLIDFGNDSFKIALFTNSSNAGDVTLLNAWYATLTNEVSNANGYTTGGNAASLTWAGNNYAASKSLTWLLSGGYWTASGNGLTAFFAVLYDNTTANKDLLAYCLLDWTGASVVTPSGQNLDLALSSTQTLWQLQ